MTNFEKEKLDNDILYLSMLKSGYSYSDLIKSGWINTTYSHTDNITNYNIFSTPLNDNIISKENPVILISTGSFAPSHFGHIEMMINAKNFLDKKNIFVDSIILSPSHDNYVLHKSDDIKIWDIDTRLNQIQKTIADYPYSNQEDMNLFHLDLWESKYCNCPVNFSDVLYKINLNKINKKPLIFYVFGSDNLDFYKCFENNSQYFGICVERVGFPNPKINSNKVFFIKNKIFDTLKSRDIRKAQSNLKIEVENNIKNSLYVVRNDKSLAISNWIDYFPKQSSKINESYNDFYNGLCNLVETSNNLKVLKLDSDKQYELLVRQFKDFKIINLDPCTNFHKNNNHYKLDLSRYFNFDFLHNKPKKLINRYNDKSIIPIGDYILVDDDISSGFTMSKSKEFINQLGSKVSSSVSLLDIYIKEFNIKQNIFDIVDARDFLLGANTGGLVCNINKNKTRIPYFLPWINLSSRAKLKNNIQKEFMVNLLLLNLKFFQDNDFIYIQHIDKNLLNFLKLNYSFKTIPEFILQHISWIEKNMS